MTTCPQGFKPSFTNGNTCVDATFGDLPVIYFPFLIACLILMIVSIGGYIKDKRSHVISNIVVLWGPIEMIAFLSQTALCFMFSTWKYAGISAAAFIMYVAVNIGFTCYFKAKILPDKEFTEWRTFHGKTSKAIMVVATALSFKVYRLFYSHLYGHDNFKANFSLPAVF